MHKNSIAAALMAGALILVLAALSAPALAGTPATVSVRVEGESSTLLPLTAVTTTTTKTPPPGNCPGTSAAGALQLATEGNWDHQEYIRTILGETHEWTIADPRYWAVWIDDKYSEEGACSLEMKEGDRVLFLVDRATEPEYLPTVFPLELYGAPAEIAEGESANVTVDKYNTAGTASPASGVSIKGGESTVITNASGEATVKFKALGTAHLRGTKSGFAPTASVAVCVHVSGGHC
ncbi:MAG TPA: DUF4430 domain-containing protein [Solirubrobacteraceae bacterium]|nr:DUF4430 domain-containing protein [Solirubrobacteraceae bacterium]